MTLESDTGSDMWPGPGQSLAGTQVSLNTAQRQAQSGLTADCPWQCSSHWQSDSDRRRLSSLRATPGRPQPRDGRPREPESQSLAVRASAPAGPPTDSRPRRERRSVALPLWRQKPTGSPGWAGFRAPVQAELAAAVHLPYGTPGWY